MLQLEILPLNQVVKGEGNFTSNRNNFKGGGRCGDLIEEELFVNDVIADKNVVTKIMKNFTGLQRIELNGFAKRHWQTGYYPFAYGWCLGLC